MQDEEIRTVACSGLSSLFYVLVIRMHSCGCREGFSKQVEEHCIASARVHDSDSATPATSL
eukprot:1652972-Amphidinium_carterae.1